MATVLLACMMMVLLPLFGSSAAAQTFEAASHPPQLEYAVLRHLKRDSRAKVEVEQVGRPEKRRKRKHLRAIQKKRRARSHSARALAVVQVTGSLRRMDSGEIRLGRRFLSRAIYRGNPWMHRHRRDRLRYYPGKRFVEALLGPPGPETRYVLEMLGLPEVENVPPIAILMQSAPRQREEARMPLR